MFQSKSIRGASSCGSISVAAESAIGFPGTEELRKLARSGKSPEYVLTSLVATIDATSTDPAIANDSNLTKEKILPKHSSVVNLPTFVRQSEKVPLEVLESLSANKRLYNVILENYPSLLSCRSLSENQLQILPQVSTTRVPVTMSMRVKRSKGANKDGVKENGCDQHLLGQILEDHEDPVPPIILPNSVPPKKSSLKLTSSKKNNQFGDIGNRQAPWLVRQCSLPQNQHYLRDIKLHRNSVMYRGAMLNIHKYRLRASSCPDIYRNSMTTIARENEEVIIC